MLIYKNQPVTIQLNPERTRITVVPGANIVNNITTIQGVNTVNGIGGPDVQLNADNVPITIDALTTNTESAVQTNRDSIVSNASNISSNTSDISTLQTDVSNKIDVSEKGVANGVATLNAIGQIPASQIPPTDPGDYLGERDADANNPLIQSGVGNEGDFYRVSVSGATLIDGNSTWVRGDTIRFDNGVWVRVPGFLEPSVLSVVAGTDISVNNTDPENPVVSNARVYGSEYFQSIDYPISTTTSATFQSKLTLNSNVQGGDYVLEISYGRNHDSTTSDFETQIQYNGTFLPGADASFNIGTGTLVHKEEPKDSAGNIGGTGSSQVLYFSQRYPITLPAGVQNFELFYRTDTGGNESSIWSATMTLTRVG